MKNNTSLKNLNTFRVSSNCDEYISFKDEKELFEKLPYEKKIARYFLLGGGSNTLFKGDFDGVVLHHVGKNILIKNIKHSNKVRVTVDAGHDWDLFVENVTRKGYKGLENLSLIPGNVGAAPVQNIGAYGAEVSNFITKVKCFNVETREIEVLKQENCGFSYRNSIFKARPELMVMEVEFELTKFGKDISLIEITRDFLRMFFLGWSSFKFSKKRLFVFSFEHIRDILKLSCLPSIVKRKLVCFIRKKTMPDPNHVPNVGCFFKSPIIDKEKLKNIGLDTSKIQIYPYNDKQVKVSAGDLIKFANLGGFKRGNVHIDSKRPLIIISNGQATGEEIYNFSRFVQEQVAKVTKIEIQPEVVIVG